MAMSLRQRVWNLVEAGKTTAPDSADTTGTAAHASSHDGFDWFDWMIAILIVLNVIALIIDTEPALPQSVKQGLQVFEVISLVIFSIEYLLRLWACTVVPGYAHPVLGRLKFATRPLQIVDLLAILPGLLFFLPDLRFVRALRLLRILRVLKLGRYSEAVTLLGRVLTKRRPELMVMVLMLVILLILSSSALYYAEGETQPDKFGSITQSLWWAVITLTTIGYGDAYPVTSLGKVMGGVIAVAGIGIVALPTAIIAAGYSEEIQHAREARQRKRSHEAHGHGSLTCPHCGKPVVIGKASGE